MAGVCGPDGNNRLAGGGHTWHGMTTSTSRSGSDSGVADEDDGLSSATVSQDVEDGGKKCVLSHNEKYRAVFAVCQWIAECVADKGKKELCRWHDHLEELERMARENEHHLSMHKPPDDATADIDSKIDVTGEIGDIGEEVTNLCGDTNSCGDTNTKRPVEATSERNETTESVSNDDLGSLVEQVLLDSSAKGKLDTIPSAKRKLEMDEQTGEKTAPRAPKARSRSKKTLVQLNPASRASGRPKQKASFKKAKKAKEIEEIIVFVDDIVTIGDVTLENSRMQLRRKCSRLLRLAIR
ncbi:hypothetical protein PC128_g2076 [Phytophthora cactorum]|nr:hypothetical protein PC128_g2076 [Phytophthora cactorum]